jgi:hypothetical protein
MQVHWRPFGPVRDGPLHGASSAPGAERLENFWSWSWAGAEDTLVGAESERSALLMMWSWSGAGAEPERHFFSSSNHSSIFRFTFLWTTTKESIRETFVIDYSLYWIWHSVSGNAWDNYSMATGPNTPKMKKINFILSWRSFTQAHKSPMEMKGTHLWYLWCRQCA